MKRGVIVEKFGKIEHAELEIKPMMMFVGDNNSGKSYLMSLLWGLLSKNGEILTRLNDNVKNTKLYEECERYVTGLIELSEKEVIISKEWFERFWHLLNECIEQNKDLFVSNIFNKNMYVGRLELKIEDKRKLEVLFDEDTILIETMNTRSGNDRSDIAMGRRMMWIRVCQKFQTGISITDNYLSDGEKYVGFILRILLRYWGDLFIQKSSTVFLPSSRTGFVLSKNLLTNNVYESSFNRFPDMVREGGQEDFASYFTKPVISFLKLLNSIGEKEGKNQELEQLAEFIEQTILHGQVEIQNKMTKSFLYKSEKSDVSIQMYLASAIVTEITPLYLLCRSGYEMTQMFIEEPEMCMHPKLQAMVARVLVRLCNIGIPVTMTTHSDIIIQHINNMIRVKNSDKRQELMERFQIEEQDLLGVEDVGVYQFSCQKNDYSKVRELKAGEMGFEIPTFSDAFEEMLELTYDI